MHLRTLVHQEVKINIWCTSLFESGLHPYRIWPPCAKPQPLAQPQQPQATGGKILQLLAITIAYLRFSVPTRQSLTSKSARRTHKNMNEIFTMLRDDSASILEPDTRIKARGSPEHSSER